LEPYILIIEDEAHVAHLVSEGLREEGYHVIHCFDGEKGMEQIRANQPQLIILDILLPNTSGLEICRNIRNEFNGGIPILMLTALSSAENVVLGLDSGADDYLTKPFKLIELKARIRNLLRRMPLNEANGIPEGKIMKFRDLEVNDDSKSVHRSGVEVVLTSTEYRLLLMFLKNRKRVLSKSDLLEEVWGIDYDTGTNVVEVYVNYLRKKLETNGGEKLIHTVIGMGYVLK